MARPLYADLIQANESLNEQVGKLNVKLNAMQQSQKSSIDTANELIDELRTANKGLEATIESMRDENKYLASKLDIQTQFSTTNQNKVKSLEEALAKTDDDLIQAKRTAKSLDVDLDVQGAHYRKRINALNEYVAQVEANMARMRMLATITSGLAVTFILAIVAMPYLL